MLLFKINDMLNTNSVRRVLSEKSLLKKISIAIVVAGALIGAYKSRRLLQNKLQNLKEKAGNKHKSVGTFAEA